MAGAEVDTAMHPGKTQNRMDAQPEAGGDPAGDRPGESGDLPPRPIGVDPIGAAADGPFHQPDVGRRGTIDRCVEQRSFLAFTGRGATIGDNQIEAIVRPELRANVELGADRAKIFAGRLRRHARRAQRPVEAVAYPAADS